MIAKTEPTATANGDHSYKSLGTKRPFALIHFCVNGLALLPALVNESLVHPQPYLRLTAYFLSIFIRLY